MFPEQSILGGAPFNVARHLQVFGLHPLLISRTGSDVLADALLQEMAHLTMDVSGIQRDVEHPTGQVQVIFENGDHRFDILPDQAYDHINAATTHQTMMTNQPQLAYFGTLALRSEESHRAATQFLQDCTCPIFLDINLRAPWHDEATITFALTAADIVKLNDEELQVVAGLFGLAGLSVEAQAIEVQKRFALQQVLVTCGATGCWLVDEQQRIVQAAPIKTRQSVIDTVGAGDAFAAVFMLGMLRSWDTPTTLQRASAYAAAMCAVRGAAPPSDDFFQQFNRAWNSG